MALEPITLGSAKGFIMLGPRTFGVRKGHEGIIWHTTEYANFSRAEAERCVRNQSARDSTGKWLQPGSYNIIIYDGGFLLSVPFMEASGGVNPFSSAWAPEAWLKNYLSPAAFADPAAYNLQIAFSGKTADIVAGRMPDNMWQTAAALVLWFERTSFGKDNAVMSAHEDYQTNRSDPGEGTIAKILERYAKLTSAPTPAPTPTPTTDYKQLYTDLLARTTALESDYAAAVKSREWMRAKIRAARPAIDAAIEAHSVLGGALQEANEL